MYIYICFFFLNGISRGLKDNTQFSRASPPMTRT